MNKIIHKLLLCSVALFLAACGGEKEPVADPGPLDDPTSAESLRALIPNLVADMDWDLSGKLRWGYVFTDPRKDPLVKLSEELTKLGHTEIELSQTITNKTEWRLHTEKTEQIPTIEKFVAEGEKMHQLVNQNHVLNFVEVKVSPVEDNQAEDRYQQAWWTYYSEYESEPRSISLNLALIEAAPYLNFPSLLMTGIDYPANDDTPVEQRLEEIHQLRAERITKLKLFTHVIEAGAQISGGRETHYIYVNDTTGLQRLLREFYTQNYPDQEHRIEIEGNIGWDVYLRDLFPNRAVIDDYEAELKELDLWQWVEDAR